MATGQCSKFWLRRTNLEKTLISLSGILFLTSVIVILIGVFSHQGGTSEDVSPLMGLCLSKECIGTAGRKISMMDLEVDPCEDFYSFACGSYIKGQPKPVSVRDSAVEAVQVKLKGWLETTTGSNISVFEKAKALYKSCMNHEPTVNAEQIVQLALTEAKFGSWPVLDPYWTDDTDLERTLASLVQLGINVAFEFHVTQEPSSSRKQVLKISPSHRPLPDNDVELRALRNYAVSTLLELGIPINRAVEATDDIVSTEAEFIQRKKLADSECGDPTDDEKGSLSSVTAENVQKVAYYVPELDWTKFFNILYQENKAFQATKNFTFEIYCRKYIRDLSERLVHFSRKTVFNYLGWRFLFPLIPYLGEPFQKLAWTYHSAKSTAPEPVAYLQQWEQCFALQNYHMLPVILTAYRKYMITDDVLNEKVKIVSALRSSLTALLSSAEWLDDYEKDLLKDKVMESRFRLFLSEIPSKVDELDNWFEDLNIGAQIIFNLLNIQKFETTKNLQRMLSLTSESDIFSAWHTMSLMSEALEHKDNIIAVHIDRLGPPYLYLLQPSSLSFGSFGTDLAHDLLEYISKLNLMKEIKGNRTLWEVMHMREKSKTCQNELKLNASIPKDEVIKILNSAMTELSSIRVSYQAFTSMMDNGDSSLPGLTYDDEQLFFLSYAQSHCSSHVDEEPDPRMVNNGTTFRQRVNRVLKNFKPFSEAFECQSGSAMSPPSVCTVFGS